MYNGQELNEAFDLNCLDYGARWYDPAIGRWGQVDPLAELYSPLNPFHYGGNNPIINVDPTGMAFFKSNFLNQNGGHWTDDLGVQSASDRVDETESKGEKINNFISESLNDKEATASGANFDTGLKFRLTSSEDSHGWLKSESFNFIRGLVLLGKRQ